MLTLGGPNHVKDRFLSWPYPLIPLLPLSLSQKSIVRSGLLRAAAHAGLLRSPTPTTLFAGVGYASTASTRAPDSHGYGSCDPTSSSPTRARRRTRPRARRPLEGRQPPTPLLRSSCRLHLNGAPHLEPRCALLFPAVTTTTTLSTTARRSRPFRQRCASLPRFPLTRRRRR